MRCLSVAAVLKLLEPLIVHQLLNYLTTTDLLPNLQSGFRVGHSTETTVMRMLSDILHAVDHGDVAALSAAFDTVDQDILLQRLQVTFVIHDVAQWWIKLYLSGGTHYVRHGPNKSSITRLTCGVPQGSVLGPILFVLYTVDLISLIESHSFLGSCVCGWHAGVRLMPACWRSFVFHETPQMCLRNVRLNEVKQRKPRCFGVWRADASINCRPLFY